MDSNKKKDKEEKKITFERASDMLKKKKSNTTAKKTTAKKTTANSMEKYFSHRITINNLQNSKIDTIKNTNDKKHVLEKEIEKIEKEIEKLTKNQNKTLGQVNEKIEKLEDEQYNITNNVDSMNALSSFLICAKRLKKSNIQEQFQLEILGIIYENVLKYNSVELDSALIDCAVYCKEIGKIDLGIELLENAIHHSDSNPELYYFLAQIMYLKYAKESTGNFYENMYLKKINSFFERVIELLDEKYQKTKNEEDLKKLNEVKEDLEMLQEEHS